MHEAIELIRGVTERYGPLDLFLAPLARPQGFDPVFPKNSFFKTKKALFPQKWRKLTPEKPVGTCVWLKMAQSMDVRKSKNEERESRNVGE